MILPFIQQAIMGGCGADPESDRNTVQPYSKLNSLRILLTRGGISREKVSVLLGVDALDGGCGCSSHFSVGIGHEFDKDWQGLGLGEGA